MKKLSTFDSITLIASLMESQAKINNQDTLNPVLFDEEAVLSICYNLLENFNLIKD